MVAGRQGDLWKAVGFTLRREIFFFLLEAAQVSNREILEMKSECQVSSDSVRVNGEFYTPRMSNLPGAPLGSR